MCSKDVYAQYQEYEIKAQYVNLFTQYIDWPENSSIDDKNVPFRLALIGESPFGKKLKDLTNSVKIKGKNTLFEEVDIENLNYCDILFIPSSERNNLKKIVDKTKGKGILLISDTKGFIDKGVFINFYYENNRIRFEINKSAMEKEGFRISARLLKLAKLND